MLAAHEQKILVIAPHPDDETLGCGGTIKLLTQAGARVDVLYTTRGENGLISPELAAPEERQQLAERRTREAAVACKLLGVSQIDFLPGHDGLVADEPQLAGGIRTRLEREKYQRVFCPWPRDAHPDHVATYELLRRALDGLSEPQMIWLYEVWSPLTPTICVPIDETIAVKEAAIRAHESQLLCLDYLTAFRGLASYRSLACSGSRFAEAFIVCDRQSIVAGRPC